MRGEDDLRLLEDELRRLARGTAYPPTPPLAAAVRRRLEAGVPAPPPRWRPRRAPGLAVALAALLLAFALTLGLSGRAREAVADFFGLDRVKIFRLEEEPEGLPGGIVGTPVSLGRAGEALGTEVRLPTYPEDVGEPDEVLLQRFGERVGAVLVYRRPGPAFSLLETMGSIAKGLGFEATVEEVPVGQGTGLWLQGQRVFEYLDEAGNPIQESRRATDANTLIWEDGGLVFRLEGDLSREEAIRIAESVLQQEGR